MDEVELFLAAKRMQTWPRAWREMILDLPVGEAQLFAELAALLNARPVDELAEDGRPLSDERESR